MWGELKRMNQKGKYLSNVVDGINNDADIANMFADKYTGHCTNQYLLVTWKWIRWLVWYMRA